MNRTQLVKDFNDNFRTLVEALSTICPSSSISTHLETIKDLCEGSNEFIIRKFVLNVLEHKQKIDEGDDDFFLNKDYKSETGNDDGAISKVLEFKSIWNNLSEDEQNMVKIYMKELCSQTAQYFCMIDQ